MNIHLFFLIDEKVLWLILKYYKVVDYFNVPYPESLSWTCFRIQNDIYSAFPELNFGCEYKNL
jgi:hypothetical protein